MLANSLPTFDPFVAALWYFHAPGTWERLGDITVSPAGIQRWLSAAKNSGIETSWEAGICPGWSYVFPKPYGPDDYLFLLDDGDEPFYC